MQSEAVMDKQLIELAERAESFHKRILSIAANKELTPSGQAAALSLLVSFNVTTVGDCAKTLRAIASKETQS